MKTRLKPFVFVNLFVFFWGGLILSPLSAQMYRTEEKSIYLGLMGGYSHSASQGGLTDLRVEALFSLSRSIKIGFGFGYLSSSDQMHGSGFGGLTGGMTGGMMGGMTGGMMGGSGNLATGSTHTFKSTPLSLTAYWRKPLSDSAGVFLLGGMGYYWGQYQDVTLQRKRAFGPHFGLGADLRIGRNIVVIGEASYRFVNFKGFKPDLHPGFEVDAQGQQMNGFWYMNPKNNQFLFRMDDGQMNEFMKNLAAFNINLSGFNLEAGLRFGF
jgi:Outer membrane protein beta-barrel domain